MKKTFILGSIFILSAITSMASAATYLPCSWMSNYGYVKFISPQPSYASVRIALTGVTKASSSGTYNLPVPISDPTRMVLFEQTMALLRDANSRNVKISIQTTGSSCIGPVSLPGIEFVSTQVVE